MSTKKPWIHDTMIIQLVLRIPEEFIVAYQELTADDITQFAEKSDSKKWQQKFKLENILKMPVYGFNSGKVRTKTISHIIVLFSTF